MVPRPLAFDFTCGTRRRLSAGGIGSEDPGVSDVVTWQGWRQVGLRWCFRPYRSCYRGAGVDAVGR